MTDIQVFLPPNAHSDPDDIGQGLVSLTKLLHETGKAEIGEFGLGGPFGYGANYGNSIFMMHRYCWCEEETCWWCNEDACGCPHSMPENFLDGQPTSDWSAANDAILGPFKDYYNQKHTPEKDKEWDQRIAERDMRLTTVYPSRIHSCFPIGLMANRDRGNTGMPRQSAPNFWHKPSGSRIWWYKWIGRGMEEYLTVPWSEIIHDCYRSVAPNEG